MSLFPLPTFFTPTRQYIIFRTLYQRTKFVIAFKKEKLDLYHRQLRDLLSLESSLEQPCADSLKSCPSQLLPQEICVDDDFRDVCWLSNPQLRGSFNLLIFTANQRDKGTVEFRIIGSLCKVYTKLRRWKLCDFAKFLKVKCSFSYAVRELE